MLFFIKEEREQCNTRVTISARHQGTKRSTLIYRTGRSYGSGRRFNKHENLNEHAAITSVSPNLPATYYSSEHDLAEIFTGSEINQVPLGERELHPMNETYNTFAFLAEGMYEPCNQDELCIEKGDVVLMESTFANGYGIAWNKVWHLI
jgi:hypothetical protein